MKYQLVIFDFDGTLANSYPWFLSVYSTLAERFHLPPMQPAELEHLRHLDFSVVLKEKKISPLKAVQMGVYLKKLMSSQIDRIPLVDGMQTVIDELVKHDLKLAVVSSNEEDNVRRVLGAQNAAQIIAFECGVSFLGKTAKFLSILRKTGIHARQALSIGDEVRDLKSSRQAGIDFGAAAWGYNSFERLQEHQPELIFTSPLQILEALNLSAA